MRRVLRITNAIDLWIHRERNDEHVGATRRVRHSGLSVQALGKYGYGPHGGNFACGRATQIVGELNPAVLQQ